MAILGFRITAMNGAEESARTFIKQRVLLPSYQTVDNLIDNWRTVNIYTYRLTEDDFVGLPFDVEVLYTTPNITCINNTDQTLELPYTDLDGVARSIRLGVTEFTDITRSMYAQFQWFLRNAYIRCIPLLPGDGLADFLGADFEPGDFFTDESGGSL